MTSPKKIDFVASGFEVAKNSAFSVGIMENLKTRYDVLSGEYAADCKGAEEYAAQLVVLKQRREFLVRQIAENKEWAAHYDKEFGPFVGKYNEFLEKMATLYGDAKEKHAEGYKLLMEHFAYHPAFKRWSDTFSAIPFKPL
jgi:hypothetical protein